MIPTAISKTKTIQLFDTNNNNAIDKLFADNIQCDNILPTRVNLGNIGTSNLRYSKLFVNTGNLLNILSSSAIIDTITSTNATIDTITSTNATIDTITSTNATIDTLNSNSINISQIISDNIEPSSDNTGSIGNADIRFADLYAVNVHAGDVIFENSYRLSEYDDNGNLLDGIRLIGNKGKEIFKITQDGVYFKGTKVI